MVSVSEPTTMRASATGLRLIRRGGLATTRLPIGVLPMACWLPIRKCAKGT